MTILRVGNPILLRSGHLWWPFSPHPSDVRSTDFPVIARRPRWGGHTSTPMSVAEHCVRVAWLLRDWGCSTLIQLQGLTHDLHELYFGDIAGPILRSACPEANGLRLIEQLARDAVRTALGLPLEFAAVVHDADLVLLATERRDLMPPGMDEHFGGLPAPLDERIHPWSWELAWMQWQTMFVDLGGRVLAEAA